jgi:hypothetical protein
MDLSLFAFSSFCRTSFAFRLNTGVLKILRGQLLEQQLRQFEHKKDEA